MKKINAVSIVREIRDRQYKEIKNLSFDELQKYYSEKSKWVLEEKKVPD